MNDEESIRGDLMHLASGDVSLALDMAAREIAYLGRRTSAGYVRARVVHVREAKPPPPAITIPGEPGD